MFTTSSIINAIFGSAFSWVRGFSLPTSTDSGHTGIDVAAVTGTPVKAVSGGTVVFAGVPNSNSMFYAGPGGNVVVVKTADGLYENTYAHLSAISVQTGQQVQGGAQLGNVGQTGWATGPHLHFGVIDLSNPTKYTDPLPYLNQIILNHMGPEHSVNPPTDPISGAATTIGNAFSFAGLVLTFALIGIAFLIMSVIVSGNFAKGAANG